MDEGHAWQAPAYVERNPVRAGLVTAAESYAWSTAAAHCREDEMDGNLDLEEKRRPARSGFGKRPGGETRWATTPSWNSSGKRWAGTCDRGLPGVRRKTRSRGLREWGNLVLSLVSSPGGGRAVEWERASRSFAKVESGGHHAIDLVRKLDMADHTSQRG